MNARSVPPGRCPGCGKPFEECGCTGVTRRAFLLAAIQRHGRPVTTALAAQLLTGSPWRTYGRNTARKDLRGLSRCGHLTAVDIDGRRLYHPTPLRKDVRP